VFTKKGFEYEKAIYEARVGDGDSMSLWAFYFLTKKSLGLAT
jgi:hypothetical protein